MKSTSGVVPVKSSVYLIDRPPSKVITPSPGHVVWSCMQVASAGPDCRAVASTSEICRPSRKPLHVPAPSQS
jgi:hypothetical protein